MRQPTSCHRKGGEFSVNTRLKSSHVTCRCLRSAVNVDLKVSIVKSDVIGNDLLKYHFMPERTVSFVSCTS